MSVLQDSFGRTFSYLRLSLTDACNFRCQYCLPHGYQPREKTGDLFEDSVLNLSEIDNLLRAFAALGFRKLRLTGGEPTLRPDVISIVERAAAVPGIETIALTTNGYRLDVLAKPLRDAGLGAINISVDSLNPQRFAQITGSRLGPRVQRGVAAALAAGIPRVKVNVVLLRSFIEHDLEDFILWARDHPLTIRFIELMHTADNEDYFRREHISSEEFRASLERGGWQEEKRSRDDGPAVEFRHAECLGRLGLIAPYSRDFCRNCNRLRISSRGKLRLCLFGQGEMPLRHLLQAPQQIDELCQTIIQLLGLKGESHHLQEGNYGSTRNLAQIGG